LKQKGNSMLVPRDTTAQMQKWMFGRDLEGQSVFYFDLENTFDLKLCATPESFAANLLSRGASEDQAYCNRVFLLRYPEEVPGCSDRPETSFLQHYAPRAAVVITRDYMDVAMLNHTKVFFIPMWMM